MRLPRVAVAAPGAAKRLEELQAGSHNAATKLQATALRPGKKSLSVNSWFHTAKVLQEWTTKLGRETASKL